MKARQQDPIIKLLFDQMRQYPINNEKIEAILKKIQILQPGRKKLAALYTELKIEPLDELDFQKARDERGLTLADYASEMKAGCSPRVMNALLTGVLEDSLSIASVAPSSSSSHGRSDQSFFPSVTPAAVNTPHGAVPVPTSNSSSVTTSTPSVISSVSTLPGGGTIRTLYVGNGARVVTINGSVLQPRR